MNAIDSGDKSDGEPMPVEMLEIIRDGSKSHPSINMRYTCYKIYDLIKQNKTEWKGELLSMQNMGKGLHKVFKSVINEILPILGELSQKLPIIFQSLETFLKWSDFQITYRNLG